MSGPKKEDDKKITELVTVNEELENYFRNTIIPQLFVDADLILRKYTPPAMKQFCLLPKHIGRPITELSDNIRYSTLVENVLEVIGSGEILEKEIQTTDFRWYQMNIIPYIIQKENKANGVIITFVDVTDRIKTLKELEKLNASYETFIYSVSHDLKAPVSNIKGLILSLKDTINAASAEERSDIFDMLVQSAENLGNMMDELSEISKSGNDFKKDIEKVNFSNVLDEVKLTLYDKIIENSATIEADFAEPQILFSKKNIRSALYNLLSNAIKYRSPDRSPKIYIKSERVPGFVLLWVKDNGRGVEEDKKGLIFSRFTRVLKNVEGTGVGLFLVAKIVDDSGGHIEVDSQVDEGSVFKLYLKEYKA